MVLYDSKRLLGGAWVPKMFPEVCKGCKCCHSFEVQFQVPLSIKKFLNNLEFNDLQTVSKNDKNKR